MTALATVLMIASDSGPRCDECSGEVLDLGDELVCRSCGITSEKQVVDGGSARPLQAIDFTGQALGGYLGPPEPGNREKFARGFAHLPSTFRYLKLVSDYAGREDSTIYGCAKLIERVTEKLSLPRIVVGQAVTVAKTLYSSQDIRGSTSAAVISSYSLVTACRILGVTSASLSEVIEAHRLLGRRVKVSQLIQLSLKSPYKSPPRRAEDYVGKMVGRMASLPGILASVEREGLDPNSYFSGLRVASLECISRISDVDRGGHNPCSLAATAIYAGEVELSRRDRRCRVLSQKQVAEGGGVAEYTVRELFGKLFRWPAPGAQPIVIRTRVQNPSP